MVPKILDPKKTEEDVELEQNLRPRFWEAFIGQSHIKEPLKLAVEQAALRQEPLDHVLFHGPPGLGKTTLARLAAKDVGILEAGGPSLKEPADISRLVRRMRMRECLFIDEIHSVKIKAQETLLSAMEDFTISIVGYTIHLQPFTLLGATTAYGKLTPPFRDRFGLIFRLDFYNEDELLQLARNSARKLNMEIGDKLEFTEALKEIVRRARGTPRLVNRLLKRVRDYGGLLAWKTAFDALGIDDYGLDPFERRTLETIYQMFDGGPVGLSTLAAALAEDESTVKEVWEPYLLRQGLLVRTSKGRQITKKGMEAIGAARLKIRG